MRRYETIFIIRPTAGEDDITALIDGTNTIIADDGGMTIKLDKWGLRKLAYPIKKETQGHYVYIEYGAPSAAVDEMERIFQIDDRVLKYMTVKLADSFDPEAAAAAAQEAEAAKEAEAKEAEAAKEAAAKETEAAKETAAREAAAKAAAATDNAAEQPEEAETEPDNQSDTRTE